LLFEYAEKIDNEQLDPSLIDFSINYYHKQNDHHQLAWCYYCKGHMLKYSQRNDEAASMYFKALDYLQDQNVFLLSGKIYEDIGSIYLFQ